MAKKKGPDMKRILIEEGKSVSPFQNIVLKEKKEEKKPVAAPPRKKPGEIVQGYVPSASFADILESFEKTGNPYSMPKKKASAGVGSSSFGDILDEWEGKGKPKRKSASERREEKTHYQPTKSFADILSSYDKAAARKKAQEAPLPEKKAKPVDRDLRFFLSETEEDKIAPGVSWSIYGGANKDFRREEPKKEEVKEEPKYVRTTPRYVPQKSFGDILSDYGEQKKRKREMEAKAPVAPVVEKKPELEVPEEPNFFQKAEEGERVPSNVSWSIYGGANKDYVRPVVEEKKEEPEPEPAKKEPVKPVSRPYVPKKEFGEILSSYSVSKVKAEASAPVVAPKAPEFQKPEEPTFFQKMEEGDEIPQHVSWSVFGGVNKDYVRPEAPKAEAEGKPVELKRSSEPYVPTKSFGKVLKEYKPQEAPKTFEEILRDKGDRERKTRSYTINELRRMDPQTTLDLHGETQAESEAQVKAFLEDAKAHGLRKISIITGKGLHSEDGQGVLKALAERILDESGMVAERSGAPLSKGGSGAIWVILKERVEE